MVEWLFAPLQYPFMLRGLLAVFLMGSVCAVVGTFVVLRGMAFFGDALAHTILPGVAIGYLVNGGQTNGLFWWALAAALLSAVGISAISRSGKIKEDTAIGIVFAGMFALGITLISTVRSYSVDLTHFLFGDVLGVRSRDLWLSGIFGALVLIAVIGFYKEFLILSFDPILATTLRLPVKFLNTFLMFLMALAIVISLQTVGVALMVAMLITPAATAYLLVPRLPTMIWVAAILACMSGGIGLYLSYYLGIASGGAIVLVATLFFLLVWAGQTRWRRVKHVEEVNGKR
ncbi:MAG: metal ABC transporter permease [Anaerolineales bacterium]